MPTKSSERWIQDGDAVKEQLEEQGFTVDLQYAEDDIPTQVSQIENMITKGAEALIIASIDGTTLSQVLQDAADADIPVIAYDRLIRDSENVDYYASFDNYIVGVQQANSLLNGLGLTDLEGAPVSGCPGRPVQHRAVRRFARRQQRARSSGTARSTRSSRSSTTARSSSSRARPTSSRPPSSVGTARSRRSAWRTS